MAKAPKARETPEERALKEVSIAQWNDYVNLYQPAEAELMKRAELTAGELASVKGQASADTAAAFKGLTRSTQAASEASGADLSSGKSKFSLAADADARGTAGGLSQVAAEIGAKSQADKQQAGIVALGRQVAADVTADMSAGARRASRVSMAQAAGKYERNAAAIGAAATVAGAAYRKWGQDYVQDWKDKKMLEKHDMDFKGNWDANMESASLRSAFPSSYNPLNKSGRSSAFPFGHNPFSGG